ncbi:MAG TPA: SurA N-terminal domain-containing protein, partial [Rectinemataceae bacterium]
TIIAFVFIPSMGGGRSSGQAPVFGSWGGKQIKYTADSYFANQVSQINDYLKQQGLSEQNFQLYAYQVWRMAFQSAAIRTAIIATVQDAGFRVTERGVDSSIAKDQTFFEDGAFSLAKYNKTPMATKLAIRARTKEDLFVQRYYEDLYTISPSTAELAFVASMAKPQRKIEYVSVPLSSYPETEVASWVKANAELFSSLSLSRITVTSSESDAKKIRQQILDNKLSFEDAAKSHSQDAYADKGGDAGQVFFYSFQDDFSNKDDAKAVSALPKGELSQVYSLGGKTWAFFRLNQDMKPADLNSKAVLDEARAYIESKERGTLETWALAQAAKLVGGRDLNSFRRSAKAAGYTVSSAGPYIINLGNPTFYAYNQQIPLLSSPGASKDPALSSAETDEAFMTSLFSTAKGSVAKPLVMGDAVIVFAVTDDTEGTDDDAAMVKFAYPYFFQQSLDGQTRDILLKSDKFEDKFSDTFFKIFSTPAQAKGNSGSSQSAPAQETPSEAPKS